jgi:hypothetical protein
VWDLTAIKGLSILTASMQSSLISPAVRWFNLTFKTDELNEDEECATWLDDCSDILFDTIQDSNFNIECASTFADLGAYGNGCLTLETESETKWKGPEWQALPLREWYFEMDYHGKPKIFYRYLQWTASQIVSKWGNVPEDRKTIPEYILQKYENTSDTTKFDIIYCIFRRDDVGDVSDTETLAPGKRPWGCKYVLRSGGGTAEGAGDELGQEGGYYYMPVMVIRWERLSGSQWGFGPGNVALPTVKYLNAWMETEKAAAEKAVDPPIMSTQRGLLSPPDLSPGGMNVVRTMEDMKAFENKANFPAAYNTLQDLRTMVNEVFKVEDLKLKESPAMTAMEVQVRYEMMTRVLGPPAVRIQTDLLSPAIKTLFHMMARYGQFKEPPLKVLQSKEGYDIEYQGPLMKAQRAQEVAQMERLAGIVMNMVKVFPQVQNVFNPEMFVRVAADRLSVPPAVLNDEQQEAKLKAMQEASQKLALAQQASEVRKNNAAAAADQATSTQAATGFQQGASGLEQ